MMNKRRQEKDKREWSVVMNKEELIKALESLENIISLKYNGSDIDVERLRDKLREELSK